MQTAPLSSALPTARLTPAQMALVGFLSRYQGGTQALYARHLRCWFQWCEDQGLDPLMRCRSGASAPRGLPRDAGSVHGSR